MKASYFSLAVLVALVLLLNQCGVTREAERMAAEGAGTIYETDVEAYYDPETRIWWYDDTFPLVITCELRNTDGLVVATQTLTQTVPVYDPDAPVPTEPVTMTAPLPVNWELAAPLEPGLYSEWCRSEIDGHYGRSPGVECDADGFCLANEWRAPCTWGSLWRGVPR